MDFSDSPAEATFRAEVRAFLTARVARRHGVSVRADLSPVSGDDVVAAKQWQAEKAAVGFAGLRLPARYGGRGEGPMAQVIFDQEEASFETPPNIFTVGLGMCMPTLIAWATEAQRDRFVPPAVRGDEIWCQLFSEPAAGSDLAGIRASAVRDGDEWVVNGQKIWTSNAHFADWGIIMCRTDPQVPKHAGITFFFLNMRSPGIAVRPIRQMSGASNFNEVFFSDVRVPDAQRLGKVNDGWRVSITTLMNERLSVGVRAVRPTTSDLVGLAQCYGGTSDWSIDDPLIKSRVAEFWIRERGVELVNLRTITALSKGREPGPESSIAKLVTASLAQEIATYGMSLLDLDGLVREDGHGLRGLFQDSFLVTPGFRIGGGTDEILRNIIAERVLGLPAETRVDKAVPFNALQTATAAQD